MSNSIFTRITRLSSILDREFTDLKAAWSTTVRHERATRDLEAGLAGAQFDVDAWVAAHDADETLGAWAPVIGGSGGESGQAYTYQRGLWVKRGKLIWAAWEVLLSNKGIITGNVVIKTLPFPAEASMGNYTHMDEWHGLNNPYVSIRGYLQATTSVLSLTGINAASTSSAVGISIIATDIANTSLFGGHIVYRTT